MTTPTRKALLIKGPGGSIDLNEGGDRDIHMMQRLLLSAPGGSWMLQEICVLRNPTASQVLREQNRMYADYTLTYFTGHGCADGEESYWQVRNGLISELALINDSPRQLIVGDHCRALRGARISGIPEEQPLFQKADWWQARQIFDQAILDSPPGISFAWAASLGQLAWGDSSGGVFTLELIDLVHRWCAADALSPIYLDELITYADKKLGQGDRSQNPQYLAYDGALKVPFALTTAWPAGRTGQSPDAREGSKMFEPFPGFLQNPSLQKNDNGKALVLALGVVGILYLLGATK